MRDEELGELKSDVKHLLKMMAQLTDDLKKNTEYTMGHMVKLTTLETKTSALETKTTALEAGTNIRFKSLDDKIEDLEKLKKNTKSFTRTDLMWLGASFLVGTIMAFLIQYGLGKLLK